MKMSLNLESIFNVSQSVFSRQNNFYKSKNYFKIFAIFRQATEKNSQLRDTSPIRRRRLVVPKHANKEKLKNVQS